MSLSTKKFEEIPKLNAIGDILYTLWSFFSAGFYNTCRKEKWQKGFIYINNLEMNTIIRNPNIIYNRVVKNKIVDTNYKNGLSALHSIESFCSHLFQLPQRN